MQDNDAKSFRVIDASAPARPYCPPLEKRLILANLCGNEDYCALQVLVVVDNLSIVRKWDIAVVPSRSVKWQVQP